MIFEMTMSINNANEVERITVTHNTHNVTITKT